MNGMPKPAALVIGPEKRRARIRQALKWGLCILAVAFVATRVPLHDRCTDPSQPSAPAFSIRRDDGGCTILPKDGAPAGQGPVLLTPPQCAELRCEPGFLSSIRGARVDMVFGLLLVVAVSLTASAVRWRILLRLGGIAMSFPTAYVLLYRAQAAAVLLPGGIGGDALRVTAVVNRGGSTPVALASVMADRLIGLGALAVLAITFGLAFGGLSSGAATVALVACPLSLLGSLLVLRSERLRRLPVLERSAVGRFLKPMLDYTAAPGALPALAKATVAAFFVAAFQLAVVRGLVAAVGITPTDERAVYVGTAMCFVVTAIPAFPGGWGTVDAAFVYFLGRAGVPPSAALGVSLFYRLFWYVVAVIGGLTMALSRSSSSSSPEKLPAS